MQFFGGDERKALGQIKAHLIAEHTSGTGTCTVGFDYAMFIDMAHEIFIATDDSHFFII
jgi:hypothetical protein